MKNLILLILSIICTSQLFGQNSKNINVFYGAHYFMPVNGYAHGFGLQKDLLNTKFGTFNAELSALYGGTYRLNESDFHNVNLSVGDKSSNKSSQILHLSLGSNLIIPLKKESKHKFSFGLSIGYSRYINLDIESILQEDGKFDNLPGITFPTSEDIYIIETLRTVKSNLLCGSTIRYIHSCKINNFHFSIIPSYNIYKTATFAHSAGFSLLFGLK